MTARTTPARDMGYDVVQHLTAPISYLDGATAAVSVGKLPPKAIVTDVWAVVTTAFNAGSTNSVDIGTSGDTNGFATGISTTAAGRIEADEMATSNDLYSTSESEIIVTHVQTGTAATAGEGFVVVEYIVAP
jgi:hypothetical protein